MLDETWQKIAAIGVIIIIVVAALWWLGAFTPAGTQIEGRLTVEYAEGPPATYEFKRDLTKALGFGQFDVLFDANKGKPIKSISLNVWLVFVVREYVTPATAGQVSFKPVRMQYFAQFYIQESGPMVNGFRSYNALTGWGTIPIGAAYQGTYDTNALTWLANNVFTGWGNQAVNRYYSERGSGLQIGAINTASLPISLNQALQGQPIPQAAADWLTTSMGTRDVRNMETETVAQWSVQGSQFYQDQMQINWAGVTLGMPGVLTAGAGAWSRMVLGDEYTVNFKIALYYRFQDVTGQWSPWRMSGSDGKGPETMFTLKTKVGAGYYLQGDVISNWNIGTVTP